MISKEPLVSIIMNCFNGDKYLKDSINSILNQTYKNWELIFWDNKSEDKSEAIFKSYSDERFKYFKANEHTSLYRARNLAIEKSNGDFISFLDTDDLWDKKKIELQMKYFKNEKVGLVFTNYWIIKKTIEKKKLAIKKQLPRGYIYNELLKDYMVAILTTTIRKSYYTRLEKKFDERFSIVGDFDLFLRLSRLCIFESIQMPLAYYRLHGSNLSTLYKEKEIEESSLWLKENKTSLTNADIKNVLRHQNYRKFINFKINGNYKECFKIIFDYGTNLFNIKNLIILLTPSFVLKKLMWYHLD